MNSRQRPWSWTTSPSIFTRTRFSIYSRQSRGGASRGAGSPSVGRRHLSPHCLPRTPTLATAPGLRGPWRRLSPLGEPRRAPTVLGGPALGPVGCGRAPGSSPLDRPDLQLQPIYSARFCPPAGLGQSIFQGFPLGPSSVCVCVWKGTPGDEHFNANPRQTALCAPKTPVLPPTPAGGTCPAPPDPQPAAQTSTPTPEASGCPWLPVGFCGPLKST